MNKKANKQKPNVNSMQWYCVFGFNRLVKLVSPSIILYAYTHAIELENGEFWMGVCQGCEVCCYEINPIDLYSSLLYT